jgi:hypothetical protein
MNGQGRRLGRPYVRAELPRYLEAEASLIDGAARNHQQGARTAGELRRGDAAVDRVRERRAGIGGCGEGGPRAEAAGRCAMRRHFTIVAVLVAQLCAIRARGADQTQIYLVVFSHHGELTDAGVVAAGGTVITRVPAQYAWRS